MTAAAKPFHEPDENEAQIATLLDGHIDTLDHALERALHYGLEAKVREVVARHLSPRASDAHSASALGASDAHGCAASAPAPPTPETAPPAAAARGGLKGLSADQVNRLLGFLNCVQAFEEHVHRAKAGSPGAKRDASCRDFLRGEIERLKREVAS